MNITKLPDGSAFMIISIKSKGFFKRWQHKLFNCPPFWKLKASFVCPNCDKKYRCYWDGNDISGHGTNYCNACTKSIEAN